jgi:bifunctional NMN adenylyltransferase/nudix hydrolase
MTNVGIIIGRFQVPELHDGHKALIDHVLENNDKLYVLVGASPFEYTKRNPLPVSGVIESVRDYLSEQDKEFVITSLPDCREDEDWSHRLDVLISCVAHKEKPTLYTGRDGFNTHYTGKYPVEVVDLGIDGAATEIRKNLEPTWDSVEFREGVVYAIQNQYPKATVSVDAIVLDNSHINILLVRKHGETLWRLPGGVVDPDDTSLEHAMRRELGEETDLAFYTDPVYKFSTQVKDWRSTLLTNVFELEATATTQEFKDNEEIAEQRWYTLGAGLQYAVVKEHIEIIHKYIKEKYK